MATRDDLLKIIGYGAEVSEPDGKPIFGFYLDRHLRPILDQLVEYVEQQRADERERSTPVFVASVPVIVAMADLRAKVEALPSERVNGRDCYWADDVFDLIDGGTP